MKDVDQCFTVLSSGHNPIRVASLMPIIHATVAEYFAGIGLVRMGLERAHRIVWRVIFANEFNPQKRDMYASYFPDADAEHNYCYSDIFDIDPDTVPSTTLATSSFPCIDLSLAGNLNGLSGKHSSAFHGLIRILKHQKEQGRIPPLVMLENVPGWLTSNRGQDFRTTVKALNDLGYACDVVSLDAIRFKPQSRVRIFLVGVQEDRAGDDGFASSNIALLLDRPSSLASTRLKQTVIDHGDLIWRFLRDLSEPPMPLTSGLSELVETITEASPSWWTETEVSRHLEMMALPHRQRVNELRDQPEFAYRTVYRRRRDGEQRAEVRNGDTAGCLRTARGGSSRQIVLRAGKGQVRMRHMTPREYARLQGVPDSYPIPSSPVQALTGFGDAVCVPAMSWIADNLLYPMLATADSAMP